MYCSYSNRNSGKSRLRLVRLQFLCNCVSDLEICTSKEKRDDKIQ